MSDQGIVISKIMLSAAQLKPEVLQPSIVYPAFKLNCKLIILDNIICLFT